MKIGVIGCGRWGSLITWYLDRLGHDMTLYGRASSRHMQRFFAKRELKRVMRLMSLYRQEISVIFLQVTLLKKSVFLSVN